jgi:hypothetical protein
MRFLTGFSNCGNMKKASRWAQVRRDSHYRWLKEDPTYKARFDEAITRSTRILEDKAMELALEGVSRPDLHNGKAVYIEGCKLYGREYDSQMIRFLLSALDREKYGERKVVEIKLEDWDGDIKKLSAKTIKGLIEIMQQQVALEQAS